MRRTIKAGSIKGQDHHLSRRNNQDAYRYREVRLEDGKYLVGVICDGCGEGEKSEVGANLLAEYISREAERQLKMGVSISALPPLLYEMTLDFLTGLLNKITGDDPEEKVIFTRNHLLATIIGFVIGPEEGVIFRAGDGIIIFNDEIESIDEGNRPAYLAYSLKITTDKDKSKLLLQQVEVQRTTEELQESETDQRIDFQELSIPADDFRGSFSVRHFSRNSLRRLAIWTDGFIPTLNEETWLPAKGVRSLQRRLNVWAQERYFTDDTTGITVEWENDRENDNGRDT